MMGLHTVLLASCLMYGFITVQGQKPNHSRQNSVDVPSAGQDWRSECRSCNPDECQKPVGCLAGVVKDGCGCCDVCGKIEFELCEHPGVPNAQAYRGRCGDNLECRLRSDLNEGESPEAICYCRIEGALCGSDNTTYDNLCQLMAAAIVAGNEKKMTISHNGPCNAVPTIISPPENIKNTTGSSIAIMCEAKGYPIPTVEWTWTRVDGQTIYLPSDDLHVSVNMRGGPDKWQVTGWLQIVNLKKEHEGDYTCIVQNDLGLAKATSRVNVVIAPSQITIG